MFKLMMNKLTGEEKYLYLLRFVSSFYFESVNVYLHDPAHSW